jgi:hypothetical protein
VIFRSDPPAPVGWRCNACDDEGVISNWTDSPYDLRRRELGAVEKRRQVLVSEEVAAALRDLRLLDTACERLVFAMYAHDGGGAVLAAGDDELEELTGYLAAEASHEPNRRRQRRLDTAFDVLSVASGQL